MDTEEMDCLLDEISALEKQIQLLEDNKKQREIIQMIYSVWLLQLSAKIVKHKLYTCHNIHPAILLWIAILGSKVSMI
jgi:hypothetical protein